MDVPENFGPEPEIEERIILDTDEVLSRHYNVTIGKKATLYERYMAGQAGLRLKEDLHSVGKNLTDHVENCMEGITLRTLQRYMLVAKITPLEEIPALGFLDQAHILRLGKYLKKTKTSDIC